ncbi:hypothetical protein [Paenibacillus sp. GCM10012303]|uniref:hypothetical protein n=1 Tax=Paenibacillus sp. GCM10012303 TaxID=3317340 RepID=UPI003617C97E
MIKCGMSELVITPPLGSPIPGAGNERISTGVKDDLFVKALVLESDRIMVAFLVLDAIDIARPDAEAIRRKVQEQTGISYEHIIVSATHAHTSGPTIETSYVKAVDAAYVQWMIQKAADAAAIAYASRREARIGFGLGVERDIAFNRRFRMRDGSVRTNPGIGHPDIVGPEGPTDPDVPVIRIDDPEGRPIGIVTNYACHADVVGGLEYSGDYPGELSAAIKRVYGDQTVSLFFQGASGNINHIDVSGRISFDRSVHYKKMGRILAGEAIRTREKAETHASLDIRVERVFVPIRYRKPSEEELAVAGQVLRAEERYPRNEVNFARQAMELAAREEEETEAEIHAVGFGPDTALVCLPAELFVEFGLAIKQSSPFRLTIVNELSNGSVSGYVCTPEAYGSGGYENRLRKYSRLQPEAGERFVRRALELLEKVKLGYADASANANASDKEHE